MGRLAWLWTYLARQMRGPGSAIEETEQNSDRMESQNSESGSSEKQARVPRRSSAGLVRTIEGLYRRIDDLREGMDDVREWMDRTMGALFQ